MNENDLAKKWKEKIKIKIRKGKVKSYISPNHFVFLHMLFYFDSGDLIDILIEINHRQ